MLVLATSGIDYDIKLWEPLSEQPCDLSDLESITQRNEAMLQESRNTITVPSSFILHVLAYLNRRRRSKHHSTILLTSAKFEEKIEKFNLTNGDYVDNLSRH